MTRNAASVIISTMPRKRKNPSMTELLRKALAEGESLNSVANTTKVQKASLIRFLRGGQSLRLDKADVLAEHFGIESRRTWRKGG